MSHPLRLKILCVLGDKEVSVQDIVEQVGTSQNNISQHLAIMRDKGRAAYPGTPIVYYRVGDTRTLELVNMMRDVFCGFPSDLIRALAVPFACGRLLPDGRCRAALLS